MNDPSSSPIVAELSEPESVAADKAARRPAGLIVFCILVCVLAVFALLGGLMGVLSLAFGDEIQQSFSMGGAQGPAQAEAQAEMQDAATALSRRYRPLHLIGLPLQIVLGAGMLLAAIATLRLQEKGARALTVLCLIALAFEVCSAVPTFLMQTEMAAIQRQFMQQSMGDVDDESAQWIAAVLAKVLGILILAFAALWFLGKVIVYGLTVRYLAKPEVRALLARRA